MNAAGVRLTGCYSWMVVLTALLVGLAFGALVMFEPATGGVEAVLIARDSGRPVAGAEVTLEGPTYLRVKSDREGRFSFQSVPVGLYHVSALSPGHVIPRSSPTGWVRVKEGRFERTVIEMDRRPSWVELVLHHDLYYPGESVSLAVRGLTLLPTYRLEIYRVAGWSRVQSYEAQQYQKAMAKALSLGEIAPVSSQDIRPEHVDSEGVFYDRVNLGQLPVGAYFIVVTGETGARSAELLTVSRLAVLVKSDYDRSVAYVSDLISGEPVASAEVQAGRLVSRTDADGLARFSLGGPLGGAIRYTVRSGDDVITLDAYRSSSGREPYRLYQFTDRPIYRPGDRVLFKGVLRKQLGTAYELPGRVKVAISVVDPDGMEIHKNELETNDQGSFAGSFDVPAEGRTGSYLVNCRVGNFNDAVLVTVASYLKPELQLSARPAKPHYVRGQLAEVDVEAGYYFGAPAGGLQLHWTLTRDVYYPSSDSEFKSDYGESYDDYYGDTSYYGGELIAEGDARTDDAGRVKLKLPSRPPTSRGVEDESAYYDYVFTLTVWTTSEAGGSADTSAHYLVTRGDLYLIATPDRYVLTPGASAGLTLEARTFEGKPAANVQIALSLLSETLPERGGKVQRRAVAAWKATTGADGVAKTTVTAPNEGGFVLEAVASDAAKRKIALRQYLWAAREGAMWYFGEGQGDITIVPDRKSYGEQDRVTLLVTTRHEGPGIFCVEGMKLHEVRPVRLHQGANLLEVDLKPEYVPNVFVWVGQVYGKRLHQAQREIAISRDTRRLLVKVEPAQPQYRPGETATCTVTVTDPQGRPAQAELALGVVDEAIYALAPDTTEDPAEFFYYHHWNQVDTAFSPLSRYLGGADKAPASIEVRRKFVDTAFWAPQVSTDAEGRARVEFKLPDNLTSWRVTARAVSADTRGGQATANFEVNKPLMVRLDLPRFAVQGDRFRVSAYVHNETDQERTVTLASWAKGLDLESRDEELSVGAHRVVRQDWWATATAADQATIGASGVSGDLQDALELTLPLNPLARVQFDTWSGETEGAADVIFPVRDDVALDRTRLTVTVAPSIAASLFSSLDYLVHYPYGCTEQTISSFLPDLYAQQILSQRGLSDSELARRLPKMVTDGLSRLSSLTRDEGGWGWGRWGELDIWMTSYALMALQEAKLAGYQTMDPSPALNLLENALRPQAQEYPDDLAFAAYVLARYRSELAPTVIVRALGHPKLSGRGRALCALALFELGQTMEAQRVMADIWRTAKHEGKWLYWTGLQDEECRWWDGGANVEATAWSLKAALRADPKDPRAAAIAGWLLQERHGDCWVSTRDTAIALFALADYLRGVEEPNPDYTAVVTLNGSEVLRHSFTRDPKTWRQATVSVPASLVEQGGNKLSLSCAEGAGRLYYGANLRQMVRIREGETTARGDVFQVRREYFKLARGTSGGALAYGPASRAGDTFQDQVRVLVRLTIHSKQRLRYALVEDFFPAGLEPDARGDVGFMDWRSWWVDNDVRDDRVTFYLDWLPAGDRTIEYVLTARTPGRFAALPPNGFAMYQPDINAAGDLARVEVKE